MLDALNNRCAGNPVLIAAANDADGFARINGDEFHQPAKDVSRVRGRGAGSADMAVNVRRKADSHGLICGIGKESRRRVRNCAGRGRAKAQCVCQICILSHGRDAPGCDVRKEDKNTSQPGSA